MFTLGDLYIYDLDAWQQQQQITANISNITNQQELEEIQVIGG